MPGLLDLIAARNPEQAVGLLSDLVAAPRNRLRGLLDNPIGFANDALQEGLFGPPEVRAARDKFWNKEPMTDLEKQAYTNQLLNMGMGGIVSPAKAKTLNVKKQLPSDDVFSSAVANTKGAQITEDGLLMRLQRNQLENQALRPSVRGGVFYLPEGAAQAKYYSTGKNGYGGGSKIVGETLIQNPMFAKGGTGGKAPESAFDALMGKGSYQKMRTEALDVNWGRRTGGGTDIEDFLSKYAPELSGQGQYILQNSQKGNQLAYALQEAAVGSAVRNAGHDAVVGYSKGKSGPFLSEVFDVRESHYPDAFGTSRVWDTFLKD
jgi:hypothetical protein